nr:MAG TPA: hypothetical protein [Caudoviricetes sp.]
MVKSMVKYFSNQQKKPKPLINKGLSYYTS